MKRPIEHEYNSFVSYARELEAYCDSLESPHPDLTIAYMAGVHAGKKAQRQPLTDEQIKKWWASENGMEDCDMAKLTDFTQVVRAVEAAHGIKEKT